VFPQAAPNQFDGKTELILQVIASVVSLSGILVAYVCYVRRPRYVEKLVNVRSIDSFRKFCLAGWDFDALYDRIIIRPFLWLVQFTKGDLIDNGYTGIANLNRAGYRLLSKTQTGNIRWYAMGMALGAVVFLAIVILFP
jgi:NADH-quinone oxidoreductase subunit L